MFADLKDLAFYFRDQINRNEQIFKNKDSSDVKHFKADIQERIK